jgi:hypothetical protein
MVALMLVPPPTTRPMCSGMARPLTPGLGIATSPQSRSVPRLVNHLPGSSTSGAVSQPPASITRTVTELFAASRFAMTQPALPVPQTM